MLGVALSVGLPLDRAAAHKPTTKTANSADAVMAPMDQFGARPYARVIRVGPGESTFR